MPRCHWPVSLPLAFSMAQVLMSCGSPMNSRRQGKTRSCAIATSKAVSRLNRPLKRTWPGVRRSQVGNAFSRRSGVSAFFHSSGYSLVLSVFDGRQRRLALRGRKHVAQNQKALEIEQKNGPSMEMWCMSCGVKVVLPSAKCDGLLLTLSLKPLLFDGL